MNRGLALGIHLSTAVVTATGMLLVWMVLLEELPEALGGAAPRRRRRLAEQEPIAADQVGLAPRWQRGQLTAFCARQLGTLCPTAGDAPGRQ